MVGKKMKGISRICVILGLVVTIAISPCFSTDRNALDAESGEYLNAVRTFADNVLRYGRDTYGPKHTPLFVDGLKNVRKNAEGLSSFQGPYRKTWMLRGPDLYLDENISEGDYDPGPGYP